MTSTSAEQIRRISMELSALSESALAYCTDHFDIGRFHRIGALSQDLMRLVSADELASYDKDTASVAGYTTPKLDVRGAVFDREGRVLLVREIADEGRWTLPGGWCDILETPRRAIEREILEEAGLVARVTSLAAVVDRDQWDHWPPLDSHVYKLLFVCEAVGEPEPGFTSDETSEIGWFATDALPELSRGRILPEQITLLQEHWRNPGRAYVD